MSQHLTRNVTRKALPAKFEVSHPDISQAMRRYAHVRVLDAEAPEDTTAFKKSTSDSRRNCAEAAKKQLLAGFRSVPVEPAEHDAERSRRR